MQGGIDKMVRVFGIHEVELNPGVSEAEFEQFTLGKFLPALKNLQVPGVKFHLLKGDRGARAVKYLFLMIFDHVDLRDRYFPAPNQPSQELLQIIKPLEALSKIWDTLSFREKTDYIQLDE
jgi:hypothetical protein